jgi:predicted RNase H-like HicB family nuclease
MKKTFNAVVWQENKWFIAQCLEIDIASQGKTEEKALENLYEVLELHFTPPVATIIPNVRTIELELAASRTRPTRFFE